MNQTPQQQLEPLIGKTLEELKEVASEVGLRPFAAGQIARWLYQKGAKEIAEMTDLPKTAREELSRHYYVGREEPLQRALSADGTAKYLFPGNPGRNIEAVMIPDKERNTLCVSSQAGCRMGCKFCMTGKLGFNGNLTSAQIINQLLSIPEAPDLTNVVFMGMGEPLDNLSEVLKAIEILTSPWGFGWSPRRITLSTVGANLSALKTVLDQTQVHIAISVHNPYPSEREDIMPAQKAVKVQDLFHLLKNYDFKGQRRLSAEYIMWRGVNDDLEHARALARLLNGTHARVNLIRFHAIPGFDGQPSQQGVMEAFRDQLNKMGILATIRASRGQDIAAACGMLAGKKQKPE